MATFPFPDLPSQFRQLLGQCRDLYVSSGELTARDHAALLNQPGAQFVSLMDDLHRALVVKVFVTLCEADRRWSTNEKFLAEVLLFHLWGQWLQGDQLQEAIAEMSRKAGSLKWYALVRPFDRIGPLRDRISELETIVVRLANLIARADGPIKAVAAAHIQSLQQELHLHLRAIPIDEPGNHEESDRVGSQAIEKIFDLAERLPAATRATEKLPEKLPKKDAPTAKKTLLDPPLAGLPSSSRENAASASPPESTPEQLLEQAFAELDRLIGLEGIKTEVRTLANFVKVQKLRQNAGLPTAELSLHMVFGGNPGTGKTTVARIVGKMFGAMGVLSKGHLVETDRSGLVAEYAGQTGPKSNKKIDEALDGVLFIDEAYTLIASEGGDPFGREAVQTLLKRMEDQRDRLVVILAGYPVEMQLLLQSNPGLSSRFSRHLQFEDYTPLELARIFGLMCGKNHYQLDSRTRAKTILGLTWLYERRNRHFGNGRTVRNLFEHAIRRQANRIAAMENLTIEQLAALLEDDIELPDCPPELFQKLAEPRVRYRITCPSCQHFKDVSQTFLGRAVRCPKCSSDFTAEWGELALPQTENPNDSVTRTTAMGTPESGATEAGTPESGPTETGTLESGATETGTPEK